MAASVRDCIFCKIVRREGPASLVHEDSWTLAFMDIRPMNPGHVLVIPKAHAAYIEDLAPETVGPILEAAKEISRAMRASGIRCEAVSFYLANGEAAGQEVFHVHLHLIPRWRGDGFGLRVRPDYGRIADRFLDGGDDRLVFEAEMRNQFLLEEPDRLIEDDVVSFARLAVAIISSKVASSSVSLSTKSSCTATSGANGSSGGSPIARDY